MNIIIAIIFMLLCNYLSFLIGVNYGWNLLIKRVQEEYSKQGKDK